MGCCVGITTEPQKGKPKWKAVYKNLRGWKCISGPFSYRDEAEKSFETWAQNMGAERHVCEEQKVGPGIEWWVYYFKHDGKL